MIGKGNKVRDEAKIKRLNVITLKETEEDEKKKMMCYVQIYKNNFNNSSINKKCKINNR